MMCFDSFHEITFLILSQRKRSFVDVMIIIVIVVLVVVVDVIRSWSNVFLLMEHINIKYVYTYLSCA